MHVQSSSLECQRVACPIVVDGEDQDGNPGAHQENGQIGQAKMSISVFPPYTNIEKNTLFYLAFLPHFLCRCHMGMSASGVKTNICISAARYHVWPKHCRVHTVHPYGLNISILSSP